MSHNAAFFPSDPMGSHWNMRKYARLKVRRKGMRTAKRKRFSGRKAPDGWVGTGKKGAMPEPKMYQWGALGKRTVVWF